MIKKDSLTDAHMQIYAAIPKGHNNGISLKKLSNMLGLDSRSIRRGIEILITHKLPICNRMGGKGYFKPENLEDLQIERKKRAAYRNKFHKAEYWLKQAEKEFIYGQGITPVEEENAAEA